MLLFKLKVHVTASFSAANVKRQRKIARVAPFVHRSHA